MQVWMRLAGAYRKKEESEVTYKQIVRASSNDHLMTSRQIEKDLLRTLPSNICFNTEKAVGIPRLRRILRGVAWLYPDIGYCQGMGMIVAIFLLLLEEEDSFWITCAVVEDLLPASYFSSSLVGVQVVLKTLRYICNQRFWIGTGNGKETKQQPSKAIRLAMLGVGAFFCIFGVESCGFIM